MVISLIIVVGLIANWLLGFATKWVVSKSSESIQLVPPSPDLSGQWKELTGGNEGGMYLGFLERLLFFGAFWKGMPLVVGAWLAFKVASKWNAWTNIVSLPSNLTGNEDGSLELYFLIAKRKWASHVLVTFLTGTLTNIILGYVGVEVVCYVYSYFAGRGT